MAENDEKKHELTPWEQHSEVICIPRFDYKAPSLFPDHSFSGFLITCNIKREKSATKEAINIFEKYLRSPGEDASLVLEQSSESIPLKKRKACCEEVNEGDSNSTKGCFSREINSLRVKGDVLEKKGSILSLVKLNKSGLILFTFPQDNSLQPINIFSNILQSLEIGHLSRPQWCHRIFPIQETCILREKDLHEVVRKLVSQYVTNVETNIRKPIKFAIGYNRRGIDDKEVKTQRCAEKHSDDLSLLDRNKCFTVVAGAIKGVVADSSVDLKSPQLTVLVELLPISGLAKGLLVAGVSVLPLQLITVKPKLCVKALSLIQNHQKGRKMNHQNEELHDDANSS